MPADAVWPRDAGAALDRLVTDYGSWVLRLVSLHLERSLGEDVVQETFLRAYRGWPRFYAEGGATAEARVRAWLARIAVNLCRDRWRRQRSRGRLLPWEGSDGGPDAEAEATAASDPAGDPELALLAAEAAAALRGALCTLPTPDRRVLLLYYYFDLDTPALARLDGCPEATVRSRLMRARARLRRALTTAAEEAR